MPAAAPVVTGHFLEIKVDGTVVPDADQLLSIEAEHTFNRPATCTITFNVSDVEKMPAISIGAALEAVMKPDSGRGQVVKLFNGEVLGTEVDYDATFTTFVVHAADKLHRLFREDRTKAWVDVKASDLASSIASANGLTVEVDATSSVHKSLNQYNETDGDFLSRVLERAGRSFCVIDKKLVVRKLDTSSAPKLSLEHGIDLLRFNVRSTTASTIKEAQVRGWDPAQKRAVVGTKAGVEANPSNAVLRKAGDGKTVLMRLGDQSSLTAMAEAAAFLANEGSHEISGATYGAALLPGDFIEIAKVGQKYSGKYRVNRLRHRWDAAEGFLTEFWCGTPSASSLSTLVARAAESAPVAGRAGDSFTAPTIGVVTNNNDEEGGMGRVKVKFPHLDDAVESDWMRVVYPGAGKSRGLQLVPEVNDEVLVVFADGDNRSGYVIGGLYNGTDTPPFPNEKTKGEVQQKGYYSRLGAFLMFDDQEDLMQIQTSDKNVDLVMKKGGGLVVTNKDTGNVITMTADGAITVESKQGNITLKAEAGDIVMKAKNIKAEATMNVEMKATSNLKLEGTAGAAMKGLTATVEGDTKAELKGGAMTSVSGSGITEVKGSLVKIN